MEEDLWLSIWSDESEKCRYAPYTGAEAILSGLYYSTRKTVRADVSRGPSIYYVSISLHLFWTTNSQQSADTILIVMQKLRFLNPPGPQSFCWRNKWMVPNPHGCKRRNTEGKSSFFYNWVVQLTKRRTIPTRLLPFQSPFAFFAYLSISVRLIEIMYSCATELREEKKTEEKKKNRAWNHSPFLAPSPNVASHAVAY